MKRSVRICLVVFALGFGLETAGSVYYALFPGATPATAGAFLLSSWAFTLIGLPVLWLAQGAWSRMPVGRRFEPGGYFGAALLLAAVAGAIIAWPLLAPGSSLPPWSPWLFAGAVAGGLSMAFASYGAVGYGLSGPMGRLAVVVGVIWAVVVSMVIGLTLSGQLPQLTRSVATFDPAGSLVSSAVFGETVYFGVSYGLFFVVYLGAALRVPAQRGFPRWRRLPGRRVA